MDLKELKDKIEKIEITNNYDECYGELYNACIDYMNETQDFDLDYLFEEFVDYETAEERAKYELERRMKNINISKEEILKGFKTLNFTSADIHIQLVENGNIKVDNENDIEIILNGSRYWVTTTPTITEINKAGDYDIYITYKIRKDSKYNKVLDIFTR